MPAPSQIDIIHCINLDIFKDLYHLKPMEDTAQSQEDRAVSLLSQRGMARLSEFIKEGITATTLSRMARKGTVTQLHRGLYQLPDAPLDANHSLAEATKLVPKGVICLDSALAYYELTDRIPRYLWMAIGFRQWRPRITRPPIQIVRFGPKAFTSGIETHLIENVSVRIYSPPKTIADLFYHAHRQNRRYESKIGLTQALQGMKEALRLRKATPAEIAHYATEAGIWKIVQPYLEALTVDA
jgi:predicted transcriptional regulator of viral defense system